jgi:hypothetical protein
MYRPKLEGLPVGMEIGKLVGDQLADLGFITKADEPVGR